jgi:hypothetical protein
MNEVWRSVPSLEGVMASSWGRVLLPPRVAAMPNGGTRDYKPKPTYGTNRRACKGASHVYRGLYSKFYGNIKVHQAVCEAFNGPRPFVGAVVIHLDENAQNNKPENLKWGTQKENLNMPKFKEFCKRPIAERRKKAA